LINVLTEVVVVALTLSVPSFLLGTAGTLSISARALGGISGVTIFTAIYENKYAVNLPKHLAAVLRLRPQLIPEVVKALSSGAPPAVALSMVKGLPTNMIEPIIGAVAAASTASWKYVWIAIT